MAQNVVCPEDVYLVVGEATKTADPHYDQDLDPEPPGVPGPLPGRVPPVTAALGGAG